MLEHEVVPALLDAGRGRGSARLWSLGSIADAVAVAGAFRSKGGARDHLEAFASGNDAELRPVTFSLAEIRCVPAAARSVTFNRQDRKWVPDPSIAEHLFLTPPKGPVDLVTVRSDQGPDMDRAVDALSEGGHLLVVEPVSALTRHRHLQPVDDGRRLYRKTCRTRTTDGACAAHRDAGSAGSEAPTLAARQTQADLVADHTRLARSLARRFSRHGESKEDLEQVALLALVKAARRYDTDRETSFSTYATASILGEIKRHFRDKTWAMRVPRSLQESYLAVKEARESLTHELSASPTIQQIARRLGVSDELVLEAMEAGENYWPESLDVAVFEGEVGREVPVVDGGYELALERQQVVALLPRLAPRERLILKRLYFDNYTQRQVADEIGVSQMQVSRLLSRTLENLREWAAQ